MKNSLSLIVVTMLFCGCSAVCPEKAILREGLAPIAETALDENIDLASKIAAGQPLPKFNQSDVDLRKKAKESFDTLINQDRQSDSSTGLFKK